MGLKPGQVGRRRLRVGALGAGTLALVALTGCSSALDDQFKRVGMPAPASDRAPAMQHLWQGAWIAAGVIGVFVWLLIGYAVVRYRRKAGDPEAPKQTKYHLPLELFYTLVPILIIIVLFFYTVRAQDKVLAKDTKPQHTIGVLGQKWAWTFNYQEANNPQVNADVHEVGTLTHYADLYLPVNESVRFNVTAADVNHSFWVPAFLFKIDAIPGHPNSFDLTPTKIGTFDGKCAELCGTYHAKMLFTVHVVSASDYYKHLQQMKASGATGVIAGPVEATTLPSVTKESGK